MKEVQIKALANALREKLEAEGGNLGNVHVAWHAYNGEMRGDIATVDLEDNADELVDVLSDEVLDDASEELAVDMTVKDMVSDVGITGYFWRTTDEELSVAGEDVQVPAEEETAQA